jgi:hypothetical protein
MFQTASMQKTAPFAISMQREWPIIARDDHCAFGNNTNAPAFSPNGQGALSLICREQPSVRACHWLNGTKKRRLARRVSAHPNGHPSRPTRTGPETQAETLREAYGVSVRAEVFDLHLIDLAGERERRLVIVVD